MLPQKEQDQFLGKHASDEVIRNNGQPVRLASDSVSLSSAILKQFHFCVAGSSAVLRSCRRMNKSNGKVN